jgi:hypothetical protein
MEKHIGRRLSRNEVVHHKDENKSNNDINNLEIMSRSDHSRLHAPTNTPPKSEKEIIRLRERMQGSKSPTSVLTEDLVELILGPKFEGKSSRKVAIELKVAHTTIARVRAGITWSHLNKSDLPLEISPIESSILCLPQTAP